MKRSIKNILLITLLITVIITGIFCVKNFILNKKNNDLININELSDKFMDDYFEGYAKLQEKDNKENILIVTSMKKPKDTYGATDVVEAPNHQYLLQYDDEQAKRKAMTGFRKESDDIIVEENITRNIATESSDFNSWGIKKMGLDYASTAANTYGKNNVVVAIIDTGLNKNLFNQNYPGKLAGVYNTLNNTYTISDEHGHGTHVAGTVAEGTPTNVKIYSIKVSVDGKMLLTDILEAIYHVVDNDLADVINMSFGSYSESKSEYLAIKSAKQNNIICVAAAGNENTSQKHYPSEFDNTISVSSVDSNLEKSDFSNYGNSVTFTAPGTDILSINGTASGTSMATPHVVCAAAILKTFNINITFEETIDLLKSKTVDLGTEGHDAYFGYGFINLNYANFCDNKNCDAYNVFKLNNNLNISKITSPDVVTPLYNYGNNMNIANAKVYFYYNNTDYIIRRLGNLKSAEIKNYNPNSYTIQEVTINYKGYIANLTVDNTKIRFSGWQYEKITSTTARIIGMYEEDNSYITNVIIPSNISSYTITSIGQFAFANNDHIQSVTLPDTIINIESNSFYSCKNLKNINIPNNVKEIGDYAFYKVNLIENIDFPEGLTVIGSYAFHSNGLKNIILPDSLITVGEAAFYGSSITSLEIPQNLISIGSIAFNGNKNLETIIVDANNPVYDSRGNSKAIIETATNTLLVGTKNTIIPNDIEVLGEESFSFVQKETIDIPANVKKIGEYAFYGSEIITIDLPSQLTEISLGTFYNSWIEEIEIPANVKKIQSHAFNYCYYLTKVTFNENLQDIGVRAFNNTAIQSIYIPKNVNSIGEFAFSNLADIKTIVVDSENTTFDSRDNSNAIIKTSTNTLIAGFSTTKIPSSVKIIGTYAFSGNLTEMIIPEGVTTIGSYAFANCNLYSFNKLMLPKSLTSIGTNSFVHYDSSDYKWYYFPYLTIWVYDNTKTKKYIIEEGYEYKTRDYYDIDITLSKTEYDVNEQVDTTGLTIKLYYADEETRVETITSGYSITYQNGDKFSVNDTYFTISGVSETGENYEEQVNVKVNKLMPDYTIPTGLTAKTAQLLKEINLPEGFSWMDGNEIIKEIGTHKYKAKYTPSDTENYRVVENIEIPITITKGKTVITPIFTIRDKTYSGTIFLPDGCIYIENLDYSEFQFYDKRVNSIDVGRTTATFTIRLNDDKFENYTLDNGAQSKEYTVDINIIPEPLGKPSLSVSDYTYNGEEQRAYLTNYIEEKMNISGNKRTDAGEQNITISLKSNNYIWNDGTRDNVVLQFKIKKAPINVEYTSDNKTVEFNGEEHTIPFTYDLPEGVKLRFADNNGQYTLTSIPKYIDPGIYTIKYKFFINDNYEEIVGENTLKIKSGPIENNTKDYETIYDSKYHYLSMDIDADDYEVKYSINNTNYNLSSNPTFKDVGEYTVNYKITCPTCDTVYGSNKVKIYGIKSIDSTLAMKNNYLLVRNYNNSFANISNRISIFAKTKAINHYGRNNVFISSDTTKTGEKLRININGVKNFEYTISVLGDINSDGKITSADYIKIRKHIMKSELITTDYLFYSADLNEDNKITSADYIRIRKRIMEGS